MSCFKYDEPTPEEEEKMKRCKHVKVKGILVGNPVVFISSSVVLWGFVIAAMVAPDHMLRAMNDAAFSWIPEVWTWFYIISQDIWIVVLIYVMYKYGHLKLGKDDEEPQFKTATWFAMLFSAGVAVGLFYYSVAEPMWHYKGWGAPRFISSVKGYGNEDEDGMHALMVTYFHWGLHGWIPYTTMGAVLGIMTYRRGFPMTIRYCFYPIVGDRCYGIFGDFIDALSIVTTIAGVCTSLGLGAMQINQGLQRLDHGFFRGVNYNIPDDAKFSNPTCGGTGQVCDEGKESYGIQVNVGSQILIIIFITAIATLSVVSGLKRGIANISRFNFALGNFLLLVVLFHGETYFILDCFVQSMGYYIFYFFKIGFYCDAFERLGSQALGLGGSVGGGGDGWLSGWTIFYWGWWIAWGPFVGTFLARISRGRTLRQFILATLIVPTIYSSFWFTVFGGEGIRMQRQADGAGVCSAAYAGNTSLCTLPPGETEGQISSKCAAYSASYTDEHKKSAGMGWTPSCKLDPNYHGGYGKCEEYGWKRWIQIGEECIESTTWVTVPCGDTADPTAGAVPTTGPCKDKITAAMVDPTKMDRMYNLFAGPEIDGPVGKKQKECFVPAQNSIVCLYNQGTADIFFDQISSYGPAGFSSLLSALSIIALTFYFVTSSDSGSFVVDIISANGHPDPPAIQRIFWSLTEGATAIALLYAGKNAENSQGSLRALQSASMITGLPYTFVLFYCSQALVLLAKEETGALAVDRKAFNSFIFSMKNCKNTIKNTFAPGIIMGQIVSESGGWPGEAFGKGCTKVFWTVMFMTLYWLAIIFFFCGAALYNWFVVSLSFYLGYGVLVGLVRYGVRNRFKILHGDMLTDILCGIFVPMFAVSQFEEQWNNDSAKKLEDEELNLK